MLACGWVAGALHRDQLRRRIASGRAVIGPLLSDIMSADLIEFLGAAGFDFITIDAEHGGIGPDACRNLVRAADAAGISMLARVPSAEPGRILAFLDMGIQGIVLAHSDTAADATELVHAVKYPPLGTRGAGRGRAGNFGIGNVDARQYLDNANRATMCICLIEDKVGASNLAEILGVEGVDGCFVGPGDLALSLGIEHYGRGLADPEVRHMVEQIAEQTRAAGKLLMATAGSGAEARQWIDKGAQIISVQFTRFFSAACADYLNAARGSSAH